MLTNKKAPFTLPFLLAIVLAGIGCLAYANSFQGVFMLDDYTNIIEYKNAQNLSWPWTFMQNVRRPLLYLSIAINYALGGQDTFGYHLFNLAVHVFAGLTLFGIIRRSWLAGQQSFPGMAREREAVGVAFFVAALWLVHPLQTESVTYIIQRAESMMGLFYLLAFYLAIRFLITNKKFWAVLAGLSAIMSGLSKEVAVTIPLVILLYDRAYFSPSFRSALSKHRWLYGALSMLWPVMIFFLLTTQPEIIPTAGFAYQGLNWQNYAATQCSVVLYYVRLAWWPYPLVFDYDWPLADKPLEIIVPLLVLWLMFSLSLSLYRRKPQAGFWALSFFIILLPSSSVVPLKDLAFEHRMYLSLISPLVLGVWGGKALVNRFCCHPGRRGMFSLFLGIFLVVILGVMTFIRNKDYQSEMGMWRDVLTKRPLNARAHNNYGRFLADAGQKEIARDYYRRAIELSPRYADAYLNLGSALIEEGKYKEAKHYTQQAIRLNPLDGIAYNNYGAALLNEEHFKEAIPYFEQALAVGFQEAGVYHNLGIAYAKIGEPYKAIDHIKQALRINPELKDAQDHLREIFSVLRERPIHLVGPSSPSFLRQ